MNNPNLIQKLNRIVRDIPWDYKSFQNAKKNPRNFFDAAIANPTANNIYMGFVVAKLLGREQDWIPTSLLSIVNQIHRYYSDLGQHDVAYVRSQLKREFPKDYEEEKGSLLVLETRRGIARVEVCGEDDVLFRTGLPFRFFEDRPNEGNKYKMVLWNLYQNWFGTYDLTYQGSAIPEWTKEKRAKFIESLRKIEFGPKIERNGKKKN